MTWRHRRTAPLLYANKFAALARKFTTFVEYIVYACTHKAAHVLIMSHIGANLVSCQPDGLYRHAANTGSQSFVLTAVIPGQ